MQYHYLKSMSSSHHEFSKYRAEIYTYMQAEYRYTGPTLWGVFICENNSR